jgi:hypothetical protein
MDCNGIKGLYRMAGDGVRGPGRTTTGETGSNGGGAARYCAGAEIAGADPGAVAEPPSITIGSGQIKDCAEAKSAKKGKQAIAAK